MEDQKAMSQALKPGSEPEVILNAWLTFKQSIGVTSVRTEAEYEQAMATIEMLLETVGDDDLHPLADVLDYLADQVKSYENKHYQIPAAEPHETLRFLMEQHGLKQADLSDCAPQSRISELLNGQRTISKGLAKRLASRFQVRADLFL